MTVATQRNTTPRTTPRTSAGTSAHAKPVKRPRFAPHQKRWINDESTLAVWAKSRRIGADWCEAYRVVSAIFRGRERDVNYSSNKEENAREWIEYVKHFASFFNLVIRETTGREMLNGEDLLTYRVEFPATDARGAVTVRAMSSNPTAARGLDGDFILSELAWHPKPEEMFSAAAPCTMLGGIIRAYSSVNEEGDEFERFRELGRKLADPETYGELPGDELRISLHETTIHDAANEAWGTGESYVEIINDTRGTDYTPESWVTEVRQKIGPVKFPRECELIPDGESNSFFPWTTIKPAICASLPAPISLERPADQQERVFDAAWSARAAEQTAQLLAQVSADSDSNSPETGVRPRSFVGIDVGRTDDRFALAVGRKIGERVALVGLVLWRGMSFADMQRLGDSVLAWRWPRGERVSRACSDATGLGMQLAEQWDRAHGARFEGVTFTAGVVEDLATNARAFFDRSLVSVPDDRDLLQQINSVRQTRTATGRPRYAGERNESGHADAFWALALMLHAADAKEPEARFVQGGRGMA